MIYQRIEERDKQDQQLRGELLEENVEDFRDAEEEMESREIDNNKDIDNNKIGKLGVAAKANEEVKSESERSLLAVLAKALSSIFLSRSGSNL
jgi:hypothetical protein